MAIGVIGIKRHIRHHRDLGHRRLDRPDRAIGKVVGVPRLFTGFGLERGVGVRKQANRRNAKGGGLFRGLHHLIQRQAVHAGHGMDGFLHPNTVAHENRPDQVAD